METEGREEGMQMCINALQSRVRRREGDSYWLGTRERLLSPANKGIAERKAARMRAKGQGQGQQQQQQ
ncbi:hypothetical protein LTR85_012274 [Meristemomyces frigidus]|nr:hypothetical protein LTR85_012274 [Meristemomyces frigidus]